MQKPRVVDGSLSAAAFDGTKVQVAVDPSAVREHERVYAGRLIGPMHFEFNTTEGHFKIQTTGKPEIVNGEAVFDALVTSYTYR